jgi:choline kinase
LEQGDIELVVLTAGRGTRLGHLSGETPKWLLDVAGETIAERQLEAVGRVRGGTGNTIATRVVVGHAAAAVAAFLGQRRASGIELVENPAYDRLNNWYSLLLALRQIATARRDARVVVLNGDLVAAPSWFEGFLRDSATTDREALIAVDMQRELTDESMKVSVTPGPDGGLVLGRIGKVGVENPAGEYVGMFMARASVLDELTSALEGFVDEPSDAQNWYEHAIGLTAAAGCPRIVWPTPDSRWVEIDDDADHARAVQVVGAS